MSDWQTILAIDYDKWAAETYRANFPGVRVECGRVMDFIDQTEKPDCIVGGPPCQPFSLAGERKGSEDERDCVPDFIEWVRSHMPRQFLMEQVPGFLSFADGRYAQKTFTLLEDAGYHVDVKTLDAVNFGVPQFRERVWFWGIRNGIDAKHRWPKPTHVWPAAEPCMFGGALPTAITVRQALGIDAWATETNTSGGMRLVERSADMPCVSPVAGGNAMGGLLAIRKPRSKKVVRRDHSIDEPAPTVEARSALGGGSCMHFVPGPGAEPWRLDRPSTTVLAREEKGAKHCPLFDPSKTPASASDGLYRATGRRRLTPIECLRLQSGPDDFAWPEPITKKAMYRIVGNGWPSLMAWNLSRALKAADPMSETVIDLFCGGGLGAVGWHQRYWQHKAESECAA